MTTRKSGDEYTTDTLAASIVTPGGGVPTYLLKGNDQLRSDCWFRFGTQCFRGPGHSKVPAFPYVVKTHHPVIWITACSAGQ